MGFANKIAPYSEANNNNVVQLISDLVNKVAGIQLGEKQQSMVESRLKKRMIELGLQNEDEYYSYLIKNKESETQQLVSLLTTHHTYFFRETAHFDFLESKGLLSLVQGARSRGEKTLKFWSAASSTGQEAYTLAMFLKFHLKTVAPDFTFELWGSDVDSKSVATAKNGVYLFNEVKEIPLQYASGNWQKGTGDIAQYARAKDELKAYCKFEVQNLLSLSPSITSRKYDAIFCRNVFIYFTPEQIKEITTSLLKCLQPTGNLFLGISETLNGLNLPVQLIGSSIYASKNAVPLQSTTASAQAQSPKASTITAPVKIPDVLKVVCVDDSETILNILKKILVREAGYEVVGTAMNGLEARELLKKVSADVMTLDIHMPEQTGLEYLKANGGAASHPAVVMISSVSREDSDLAYKCLESGASDYVEKPALSNMAERADEIRIKLRSAYRAKVSKSSTSLALDKSFGRHQQISNPDECVRVAFASAGDIKRLGAFFKEVQAPQPPSFIFFEGSESALPALKKQLESESRKSVSIFGEVGAPPSGSIVLCDFKKHFSLVLKDQSNKKTSIMIYGDVTKASRDQILNWKGAHLLVEDLKVHGSKDGTLASVANDVVPATSFPYMSSEYLAKKV